MRCCIALLLLLAVSCTHERESHGDADSGSPPNTDLRDCIVRCDVEDDRWFSPVCDGAPGCSDPAVNVWSQIEGGGTHGLADAFALCECTAADVIVCGELMVTDPALQDVGIRQDAYITDEASGTEFRLRCM